MKELIDFFKKTTKEDKGKAIWFFVAFAFLLLILMIVAHTSTHYPLTKQLDDIRNANSKNNGVDISDLYQMKYKYKYTINHDGIITTINGRINESSEEFNCRYNNITSKYYRNQDDLYRYDNLKWIESDECSKFYKFYNLGYINKLLDEATLDHKTDYRDGRSELSLLLSVNNINKIIDDKVTDFSDNPCTISVISDKEVLSSISYDLTNYCKIMKLCKKNLNIELTYSNIGDSTRIDNPLNN